MELGIGLFIGFYIARLLYRKEIQDLLEEIDLDIDEYFEKELGDDK